MRRQTSLKELIRNGLSDVLKERDKSIAENPPKSLYSREAAQPAFKYHLNQYNPSLPLGDGTKSMINNKEYGFGIGRNKRMDDLESITVRENASVITGHGNDIYGGNLDIHENTRSRVMNDKINRVRTAGARHRCSNNLPIHKHENDILSEIENNQTLVIQGSTGCGKSTQLPQFILDDAYRNDRPVNVVVTQPRRIAAISLAMHVASERGWEVGSYVGYQVGLDRKCSNDTVITYVTTGVLLEQLIHNQTLMDYTHIILDEVHERDVDMDLLLSVVKDLLMHDTRTKVILMSATVSAEKFSCYFSKQLDPKTLRPLPGSIYVIAGKNFPVEEFFLDDLPQLGICQDSHFSHDICSQPRLTAELKEIVYQLIMYVTHIEMTESRCPDINKLNMGSVLVFLPGLNEITEMNEYLVMGYKRDSCTNPRKRDLFTNSGPIASIFPLQINSKSPIAHVLMDGALQQMYQQTFYLLALHSSIGISEQSRAFDAAVPGRRKIILSTNIAESSITVTDIRYVIDLCMVKRLRYDRETHFSSLCTEWASKSSCKQRSGRAGRVRNGIVYRLISHNVYNQFDEFCPPEILTGPLTQVILRIKEFGREPRSLLQRALDCPSLEDIGYTFLTLKEAGALSIHRQEISRNTKNKDGETIQVTQVVMPIDDHWMGELTFIGRLISALPMDLHMGKLIALGYGLDVLEECIIIAACLTVSRSVFCQPFFSGNVKNRQFSKAPNQKKVLDAFEKKIRLSEGKHSDLLTMLNAFKLWYQRTKTGAFRTRHDERKWCDDLYLDPQALREVEILTDEIRRRLKDKFNIIVRDFGVSDKREKQSFFDPNENQLSQLDDVVFSKSFRMFLLQTAIAGAFYPNYFFRTHNPFIEDDALRTFDGMDPFQCVEIGNLPMDEGYLYRDSIADHFKEYCMKYSASRPLVICRNTKAIIKFPNDPLCNGLIDSSNAQSSALSVILALRMGQLSSLKPRINMVELTHDEKNKLKVYMDSQNIKNNQILPLNYKYTTGHKHFIGFPNIDSNFVKVYVTFTNECGVFYGIYEEEKEKEQTVFVEIAEYTRDSKNLILLKTFNVKTFCLAPYQGDYYRAEIISVEDIVIQIFFVDYGNFATFKRNQIYDIPDFLLKMSPFLAVKFVLSEIKPRTAYHPDNIWNEHDKTTFRNYIYSYTLTPVSCKVFSVVDNSVRVRVQMIDHGNKILNEELIDMKIAEYAEESYVSRQDNQLRIKQSNKRHIDLFSSDNTASQFGCIKNLSIDDSECGNDSSSISEDMDQLSKLREERESVAITLSAPNHPYLMKFHGITESCKRPVAIVPDSVNYIQIESEPQNHLTRMLVAAHVQSHMSGEAGTDLMLRHTTLMPFIPGLPFIMAMIFTPYAELISDKYRTRYIGAKCGLGIDSENRPLHPANDMEIKCDVRFDESDVKNINGIRHLLNMSLGSGVTHSQDVMDRYQDGVKKFIAGLFMKHNRDLVNNNRCGEYQLSFDYYPAEENPFANRVDIKRIFIPHISIKGVAKRVDWVRTPILGDPRTERAKANWLKRYLDAADDHIKDLTVPLKPMSRVKINRDLLPEVKVCELCTQNTNNLSEKSRLGVPLYSETDLIDHLESHQHKHNVQQIKNLFEI